MDFLGDGGARPNRDLRPFLHEKIGDLTERWFRKGFNRGHIESRKAFENEEKVPRKLSFECSRKISPNQEREITLTSRIKAKKRKTR